MAKQERVEREYVFKTADEAQASQPDDGRYRLYHVVSPDGQQRFVFERNPVAALGRASKDLGIKAEPMGRNLSAGDVVAAFASLDEGERAKVIAGLTPGQKVVEETLAAKAEEQKAEKPDGREAEQADEQKAEKPVAGTGGKRRKETGGSRG